MDKRRIIKFEIISFIICVGLSFLFHFVFEWTNKNVVIGAFFPVNESVWEHSKLIFMPYLIASFVLYFFVGHKNNFLFAKALMLSICIPLMIVLFYTYSGILGYHLMPVDIAITILIFAILSVFSYIIMTSPKKFNPRIPVVIAIIFYVACIVFTYFPIKIDLFMDELNKTFGIFKR